MPKNDRSTTWDLFQRDPRNFIEQPSHGSLCGYRASTPMLLSALDMHYSSYYLSQLGIMSHKFLFHQLFVEIVLRLPKQSCDESGFVPYLMKLFAKNAVSKNIIKNFEESYQRNHALLWYTRLGMHQSQTQTQTVWEFGFEFVFGQ